MAKTVDQFSTLENFRTRYNDLANDVGDISGLRTDVTGNLIDAINSIEDKTFFYQEFLYTATASQTAFTGNDAFSNDLVFKKDRINSIKYLEKLIEAFPNRLYIEIQRHSLESEQFTESELINLVEPLK